MIHLEIHVNHQENQILRYIQFIHYMEKVQTKTKTNIFDAFSRLDVSNVNTADDPWVFRTSISQLLSRISGTDLTRDGSHHHHLTSPQHQAALIQSQQQIDINTARIQFKDIVCYFSLLEGGTPEQKLECKQSLWIVFHSFDDCFLFKLCLNCTMKIAMEYLINRFENDYLEEKHKFVSLKETDSIVNQMMNVAEYLGWDVSELRPVRSNRI